MECGSSLPPSCGGPEQERRAGERRQRTAAVRRWCGSLGVREFSPAFVRRIKNYMQYAVFAVPLKSPLESTDDMNRFLRCHRVLSVDKTFHSGGDNPCWTFCVEYLDAGGTSASAPKATVKVDYKEVLSEAEFALYARLRELRKAMAEKEAVPAYAIFTNEQLAKMVTAKMTTATALESIDGVGPARVAKYGDHFLPLLKEGFAAPAAEESGKAL